MGEDGKETNIGCVDGKDEWKTPGTPEAKNKGRINNVTANEWKKIRFCVDSGAGETVMAEDELPEIETKESWGSKRGQSYEVANGDEIDNKEHGDATRRR